MIDLFQCIRTTLTLTSDTESMRRGLHVLQRSGVGNAVQNKGWLLGLQCIVGGSTTRSQIISLPSKPSPSLPAPSFPFPPIASWHVCEVPLPRLSCEGLGPGRRRREELGCGPYRDSVLSFRSCLVIWSLLYHDLSYSSDPGSV